MIQEKIGLPVVTMEVIPEPGTALLFGLGFMRLATQR
ncbi:MAG: PEP-CTERM sorting domain-containing protein [Myxococcota bacterium]